MVVTLPTTRQGQVWSRTVGLGPRQIGSPPRFGSPPAQILKSDPEKLSDKSLIPRASKVNRGSCALSPFDRLPQLGLADTIAGGAHTQKGGLSSTRSSYRPWPLPHYVSAPGRTRSSFVWDFSLIQTVEWISPTVIQSQGQPEEWSCHHVVLVLVRGGVAATALG